MIVDGFIVKNEGTTFGSTRPKSTARFTKAAPAPVINPRNCRRRIMMAAICR